MVILYLKGDEMDKDKRQIVIPWAELDAWIAGIDFGDEEDKEEKEAA